MRPELTPTLAPEQHGALDDGYRATRAQMVLLAAEQHLSAAEIAAIVRESEETVRRWLKRFQAEGLAGLYDRYRGGVRRTCDLLYPTKCAISGSYAVAHAVMRLSLPRDKHSGSIIVVYHTLRRPAQ